MPLEAWEADWYELPAEENLSVLGIENQQGGFGGWQVAIYDCQCGRCLGILYARDGSHVDVVSIWRKGKGAFPGRDPDGKYYLWRLSLKEFLSALETVHYGCMEDNPQSIWEI